MKILVKDNCKKGEVMIERLIFRCLECGHSKEILESLENIDKEQCFCPMCGCDMELQDTGDMTDISHIVKLDCLAQMKNNISEQGNDKVWEIIEAFSKAKTRIAYRTIFFNAGGYVPEQGGD